MMENAEIVLTRILHGRHSKSFFLVGLRGVGKTVLLNNIQHLADRLGYQTAFIESPEGKSLASSLVPQFRKILLSLNRGQAATVALRKAFAGLVGFARGLKLKVGDLEIEFDQESSFGNADSGDIENDLPELMILIGEAAKARQTGVAIFVDELQYLNEPDFSALIMAVHRISQRNLPVIVIGAGLPQLVALAGESKSYSERLFSFPKIGALDHSQAIEALAQPVKEQGVSFTTDALEEIVKLTEGYPYFLQEWGASAWDKSQGPEIGVQDVRDATKSVIRFLDENFFRVRFDRLTPTERRYLRAMAELGSGPHRSGDISNKLGLKVSSVAPTRSSLIKKGMIFSPLHGDTEFTVPLFDQFMKRIMPEFE